MCFFFEHVLLLPHASYSPTYIVRVGCRLDVMPVICVFVSFLLDDYCGVDDTDVNRFCSSVLVSDKCLDTGRCGRFPAAVTPPKCVCVFFFIMAVGEDSGGGDGWTQIDFLIWLGGNQ